MDYLISRLQAQRNRGAITGPHGSGKTVLLRALAKELSGMGHPTVCLSGKKDSVAPLRAGEISSILREAQRETFFFIDEGDMMSSGAAIMLSLLSRRAGGVVIACHEDMIFPTIHRTRPDRETFAKAISSLLGPPEATKIMPLALEIYESNRGDMRETFRDLYDLYSEYGYYV
jgi:molybdopterin-guanine dinucleotide biosynthesis protein